MDLNNVNIRDVRDFGTLLAYCHDKLGWNIGLNSFTDIEDVMYEFTAADLGLKNEEFAKIKSLHQLPSLVEEQEWGIFCVEFDAKKLSITALRKILSRLVPSRRNATLHTVWNEKDLLFLCFWGTGSDRTLCLAHFEQNEEGCSFVRTFHCAPASEDPAVLSHFTQKLSYLEWPYDPSDYETWHSSWLRPFDTCWGEVIKTSDALAMRMAEVAVRIKNDILEAMRVETANGFAHLLFEKVKSTLVHDLDESDFADMYAQTIVYGLFSARCLDKTPDTFSVEEAISLIPNTNPFLKNMMRDCCAVPQGGGISFDELGVADVVDMFAKVDAAKIAADFGKQSGGGREDPVIYFYEEFLKAYDKEQKVKCGEFYTPMPVVGFMVRAVDHILRTQFNMPDGLATEAMKTIKIVPEGKKNAVKKEVPAIQILDPALGTGTFLREIILNIYETFRKNYAQSGWRASSRATMDESQPSAAFTETWSRYVDRNVLPRLNGFELMMAPYAIAHMKLAMVLQDTGYDFKGDKRLQVYLTNSLEEPGNSDKQMTFFDDPLAAESVAANVVKKNTGINIVIGNPPYSGISQNNGEWITKMVNEYKVEPGGKQKLQERKNWLNDDYVKFMRLAQHFVERGGAGVLAYINPHGFIYNPTFRGMRWRLTQAFDEIYIINLHGNSKRHEVCPDGSPDENVFDIMQGVSINIFVKRGNDVSSRDAETQRGRAISQRPPHCIVRYADVWGLREGKYRVLEKDGLDSITWQTVEIKEPMCFFVPKNDEGEDEYKRGFKIDELMNVTSSGIVSMGDPFAYSDTKAEVIHKIQDLFEKKYSAEELTLKYSLGKNYADFILRFKQSNYAEANIMEAAYRPYDYKWTYFSGDVLWRTRSAVLSHFLGTDNVGLCCIRISSRDEEFPIFATNKITDKTILSSKDNANVFPLYLYQEYHGKMQKAPNLNPEIVKKIAAALGEEPTPEDTFNYIYAVLHSPSYRDKYKEFLKIDFPRIPYPTDATTFHALATLGAQLVAIHTMKDFDEADDVTFDDAGGHEVVKVVWKNGVVYINKESRFTGVDEATWSQYIGGYQPLQKWLKDRKGRKLSDADISHYKRIVRALRRTAALMAEIDKLPVTTSSTACATS